VLQQTGTARADAHNVASNGTFAGVSPLVFGDFKRFVIRQAEQNNPYIYRYTVPAKDGGAVIAFRRSDTWLCTRRGNCAEGICSG